MTQINTRLSLTIALGSYGHTAALRDGSRQPEGVELRIVDLPAIGDAFKPMCRDLAFDVSEMSITGYLLGKVYDKGFTAIPVFPVRAFGQSHAAVTFNERSGIKSPQDLEGRKVGARAYTGAASFWARGVLQNEYGVDAGKVTWVSADEEHVFEFQKDAPSNAVYELGADLAQRLIDGELDAGIGVSTPGVAQIRPLIPDARAAATGYYRRTGVYQINHVIVIKDSLLREHPWLAPSLYDAFVEAKEHWLAAGPEAAIVRELDLPNGDPFPYGVQHNLPSIESLLAYGYEQQILPRRYAIEELFPEP